jgi:predicted nucleic acid-binding protein
VKRFVVDTNLYVRAFRSADDAAALQQFYSTFAPAVWLSSVVLFELIVGAATTAKQTEIDEWLARPLRRVNRIQTPSHSAWEGAGRAVAALAKRERMDRRVVPKSLINDALLAASCRDAGATLVTDNAHDFERIARFIRFRFTAPWPS